jgi:hypothetical protein
LQQVTEGTAALIITNRNIISSKNTNVFWMMLADANDISRIGVLADVNKVFGGQIIDQRTFPDFYGVFLDPTRSVFSLNNISAANTVFAGTDRVQLQCGMLTAAIASPWPKFSFR